MKSGKDLEKTRKIGKPTLKFFSTVFRGIAELRVIPGFGPRGGLKPGGLMTGSNQKSNTDSWIRVSFGALAVPVDDGRGWNVIDETPLSANRRTSSSSNRTFLEEKPI